MPKSTNDALRQNSLTEMRHPLSRKPFFRDFPKVLLKQENYDF